MLPLLEGTTSKGTPDEVVTLRRRISELETDYALLQSREERLLETNQNLQRAVAALRRVLEPQYIALQAIFGQIYLLTDNPTGDISGGESDPKRKVWESWKSKLGGMSAKFIDALLEHGEMSVAQLRVAMKCRQQTVYDIASKLGRLGLLDKNNNRYSLKKL